MASPSKGIPVIRRSEVWLRCLLRPALVTKQTETLFKLKILVNSLSTIKKLRTRLELALRLTFMFKSDAV